MSDSNSDAPNVRIVPPLIYLTGLVVGFLANAWMPIEFIPDLLAWALGGAFIACGALLTGSALLGFRGAGTTVRPDAQLQRLSSQVRTGSPAILCISDWRSLTSAFR